VTTSEVGGAPECTAGKPEESSSDAVDHGYAWVACGRTGPELRKIPQPDIVVIACIPKYGWARSRGVGPGYRDRRWSPRWVWFTAFSLLFASGNPAPPAQLNGPLEEALTRFFAKRQFRFAAWISQVELFVDQSDRALGITAKRSWRTGWTPPRIPFPRGPLPLPPLKPLALVPGHGAYSVLLRELAGYHLGIGEQTDPDNLKPTLNTGENSISVPFAHAAKLAADGDEVSRMLSGAYAPYAAVHAQATFFGAPFRPPAVFVAGTAVPSQYLYLGGVLVNTYRMERCAFEEVKSFVAATPDEQCGYAAMAVHLKVGNEAIA
jgi:hypothetical protein